MDSEDRKEIEGLLAIRETGSHMANGIIMIFISVLIMNGYYGGVLGLSILWTILGAGRFAYACVRGLSPK